MGKINILENHVANQIAAGEVVERPASVVKELVENSIDAGSTKIEVNIKDGGLELIQVKDNGEGIFEDDVEKAFSRHATSKIISGKDLFRLTSLGFRGEALPSIAAVSRLTLKTSATNDGRGIQLQSEGGRILDRKEIAYIKGTEVSVQEIFFNTPARLKYLKSLQTELGHITDYMNRLSLGYPNISFTLIHNDRQIIRTNGNGNLSHVIAAIYGTGVAKNMLEIQGENLDFNISGFISKPEITRANKNHISLFVNGRYIKNFLLSQAIIKGYKSLLMVNRFPIAVLHIKMDPSLVDVNVHPAKLEARFSKEQELSKFIEEKVYKVLNREAFIREPVKSNPNIRYQHVQQDAFDFNLEIKENLPFFKKSNIDSDDISKKLPYNKNLNNENLKSDNHDKLNTFEEEVTPKRIEEKESEKLPFLDPIAQIQGTYIVAQNENGLYLIDQHAAHERIKYENNLDLMNEEDMASQELLIPLTMDFPKTEIDQIMSNLEELKESGLEIEPFGPQTILIRSTPQWIPKGKEIEFIEKIIIMVTNENKLKYEELRHDLVAGISCKSAIKANKYLTKKEMEVLIEQLRQTQNPFSCPHGRPTIIHFSYNDIEKMFKRVV